MKCWAAEAPEISCRNKGFVNPPFNLNSPPFSMGFCRFNLFALWGNYTLPTFDLSNQTQNTHTMKTMITTAMVALLSLGTAKANNLNVDSNNKATELVSVAATTYRNVAELSEENSTLRLKVAALAEEAAELKSLLDYERMMTSTINHLEEDQQKEMAEEMEAKVNYNKVMTSVLLNLPKAQ
jgi:hypothetical protein